MQQTLSMGGCLVSDILEVTNNSIMKRFLIIVNIEKVFDSASHKILLRVPEKYGFYQEF